MTVLAWVQYDGSGTNEHTVMNNFNASNPSFNWRIEPATDTQEIFLNMFNDTNVDLLCTDLAIPVNEWSLIGFRYDGSEVCCWVNGVESTTCTAFVGGMDQIGSTGVSTIGGHATFTGDDFGGPIAEVMLWDNDLTDKEMVDLYNARISRHALQMKPDNLQFYQVFDNFPEGTNVDGENFHDYVVNPGVCTGDDQGNTTGLTSTAVPFSYP